jgi:hypothetical protein
MAASQNGFCSHKLSLLKETNIIQNITIHKIFLLLSSSKYFIENEVYCSELYKYTLVGSVSTFFKCLTTVYANVLSCKSCAVLVYHNYS